MFVLFRFITFVIFCYRDYNAIFRVFVILRLFYLTYIVVINVRNTSSVSSYPYTIKSPIVVIYGHEKSSPKKIRRMNQENLIKNSAI